MHDLVIGDLEQARHRTLGLTDLDDPTLVTQYDLLMSPLVRDLAHVGQQEELWLLRTGGPTRPRMLPPAVDALYDAFKHPRADRPSPPLLPPVEARAYDHEVRGRVLDLIEHTPADELFTAGMVVQHEEQHGETMLATLELRQRPPMMLGRRAPAARPRRRAGSRFRGRRAVHAWRGHGERAVLARQRTACAHRGRRHGSRPAPGLLIRSPACQLGPRAAMASLAPGTAESRCGTDSFAPERSVPEIAGLGVAAGASTPMSWSSPRR